jgi:outer membrane protein assembly factor BamB
VAIYPYFGALLGIAVGLGYLSSRLSGDGTLVILVISPLMGILALGEHQEFRKSALESKPPSAEVRRGFTFAACYLGLPTIGFGLISVLVPDPGMVIFAFGAIGAFGIGSAIAFASLWMVADAIDHGIDIKEEILEAKRSSLFVELVGAGGCVARLDGTGRVLWRNEIKDRTRGVAVTGDGARIFLACLDGKLRAFDSGGTMLREQKVSEALLDVACALDGSLILAVGWGGVIALDSELREKWRRRPSGIMQRALVSRRGDMIVTSTSADRRVTTFDREGKVVWQFATGGRIVGAVQGLSATQDLDRIAVAARDGHVYLLDRSGKEILRSAFPGWVGATAISPDASIVAVVGKVNEVTLIDRYGNQVHHFACRAAPTSLRWSPDGSILVATFREAGVAAYDRSGKELWRSLDGESTSGSAFSGDGTMLLVC